MPRFNISNHIIKSQKPESCGMTYAFVFSWLFFCMFLCLLICFLRFSHVFLLQGSVKLTLIENILLLISSVFMAYRLYDFMNYSFRLALVQRRQEYYLVLEYGNMSHLGNGNEVKQTLALIKHFQKLEISSSTNIFLH